MAISRKEYERRKAHMLAHFVSLSRDKTRSFTCSSAWLQSSFGTEYATMVSELRVEHGLDVVEEFIHGFYAHGKTERKGKCRTYAFKPSPIAPGNVQYPQHDDSLSDDEAEFRHFYLHSNLAALGKAYSFTAGRGGDGRFYTTATRLKKSEHALLRIGHSRCVEVDILNAFARFLIAECPTAEDQLRAWANGGRLYEELMDLTSITDRTLVKAAFNIMLNHPGRLTFQRREYGFPVPRTKSEFVMHRTVCAVRIAFPHFYRWARATAKNKGRSYEIASQSERTVYEATRNRLDRMHFEPPLVKTRKHDSILTQEEHKSVVHDVMMEELLSYTKTRSREGQQRRRSIRATAQFQSLFVTSVQRGKLDALMKLEWQEHGGCRKREAINYLRPLTLALIDKGASFPMLRLTTPPRDSVEIDHFNY